MVIVPGQLRDSPEASAAISRHFERDPIPYALETDWPVEVAGFEPLHFRIEIANPLKIRTNVAAIERNWSP
jgi:hypothetical protein